MKNKIFVLLQNQAYINHFFSGWDDGLQIPEVKAQFECSSSGAEKWQKQFIIFWTAVAIVKAKDLNGVFHSTNTDNKGVDKLDEKMRSASVGDIIIDEDGNHFMIDNEGFTKIKVPSVDYIVKMRAKLESNL